MTWLPGRLVRFALEKSPADQLRALRSLVRHAAARVPAYVDLYAEAGVRPREIESFDDLARLPVVTRAGLLSSGHEGHLRRGADPKRLGMRSTSGSTGEPLTVFTSRAETLFRKVTLLDSFRRAARFSFPVTIADVGTYTKGQDVAQALRLVRIARIPRLLPIYDQAVMLGRTRPHLVEGRPTSLQDVVREARRRSLPLPRPRAVVTFGELLHSTAREELESAFACRVVDYYNCEEVGNVAWQCPMHADRMHVNGATCLVEIVDDEGRAVPSNGPGQVVVTNLYNWTMPFIRYALGDRAANLGEEACDCGFVGHSIGTPDGRDEDFFTLPDGRRVSPRTVHSAVAGGLPSHELGNDLFRAIHSFQIVQNATDHVVVNVVPGPGHSPELWRSAGESARRLHPALRVEIRCVEALESSPGGKIKQVMSRVPVVADGPRLKRAAEPIERRET